MKSGRPAAAVLACAIALVSGAAGCRRGPAAAAFPGAPVILVSVDTLRSDHLPAYGYKGVETPALDALRKDSILFTRAWAHVPLTLPSHASMFTGREPSAHGIHDNLGYRLRADVPTLAELLKKEGYETGAAVSCFVLKGAASGISRGFDFYDDAVEPAEGAAALGRVQRAGPETVARLETWLAARPTSGKTFAFLHLYEPHTPYEPPEPFRTRYAAQPYDGEIAESDAIVGGLVAFLKARGLYDRAVIVFLSDHGEGLGEHGESEHGMFLYRESLQVPLFVKLPDSRRAGETVDEPAALFDVFTTIAEGAGARGFSRPEGTRSLLDPPGAPARRILSETFFPRIHFGWSELSSLFDGRWHYIEAPKPEIYDLPADPGELKNLYAQKPDALRPMLAEIAKRKPVYESAGDLDPEARKKLASLGYLSAGPSSANAGGLDDPKDRIRTFEELRVGLGDLTAGNSAKAHAIFTKLLAENPRMLDVWDMDSKVLIQLGRPEEALAALKKTVDLAPEAARTPYLREVANLCLQLGKWDEALNHAEALRALGDPDAEDIAARGFLGKGDLAAAGPAARAAYEKGSGKTKVRGALVLGRLAVMRGDVASADKWSQEAAALSADDKLVQSGLHMLRGDVLARQGRAPEAEKEFLEEIRLYPGRMDARVSLAALYASAGRREDARRTLIALVVHEPKPEAFLLAMQAFRATEDPDGEREMRREARRRFPRDPRF
ncbi:MAG TPA: sulfatase-like hydrolase/transferase [Thermoanaerobaculia bacterium]|nr:sulfatase-like hydrolase/transferase [Thermoanaerobaculia bacterium]